MVDERILGMIPKKNAPVSAPKATAPVASETPAFAKGTKPSHVLKYKEGQDGKFVRITGLFESVTKGGEKYLKGTDKENGITYVIMPNTYDANKQG